MALLPLHLPLEPRHPGHPCGKSHPHGVALAAVQVGVGHLSLTLDEDTFPYNMSTKEMTAGTWQLTVLLDDGSAEHISFGLK